VTTCSAIPRPDTGGGYRTAGIIEDCPAGTMIRWYCKDL